MKGALLTLNRYKTSAPDEARGVYILPAGRRQPMHIHVIKWFIQTKQSMVPLFQISSVVWIAWTYSVFVGQLVKADEYFVSLNRTGHTYNPTPPSAVMWEPFFLPKTINAQIGDQVHFVASFQDISKDYDNTNVRFSPSQSD